MELIDVVPLQDIKDVTANGVTSLQIDIDQSQGIVIEIVSASIKFQDVGTAFPRSFASMRLQDRSDGALNQGVATGVIYSDTTVTYSSGLDYEGSLFVPPQVSEALRFRGTIINESAVSDVTVKLSLVYKLWRLDN